MSGGYGAIWMTMDMHALELSVIQTQMICNVPDVVLHVALAKLVFRTEGQFSTHRMCLFHHPDPPSPVFTHSTLSFDAMALLPHVSNRSSGFFDEETPSTAFRC